MVMNIVAKGFKEITKGAQTELKSFKKVADLLSPKDKAAMKEVIASFSKKGKLPKDTLEKSANSSHLKETVYTGQKMKDALKALKKGREQANKLFQKFLTNKLTGKEIVELIAKDVKGSLDVGVLVVDGKLCSLATGKVLNGLKKVGKAGEGMKILFRDGVPVKVLVEHAGKKFARTLS